MVKCPEAQAHLSYAAGKLYKNYQHQQQQHTLNGQRNKMKVLKWPSQCLEINQTQMLWYDLKQTILLNVNPPVCLNYHNSAKKSGTKFERIIASYCKHLITVLAAKCGRRLFQILGVITFLRGAGRFGQLFFS